MRCANCGARCSRDELKQCDDCLEFICEACCAEFPHHDPPHNRCGDCYERLGPRELSKRKHKQCR
jgi:hypothetical protein